MPTSPAPTPRSALEAAGIITNKNAILNDPRPPKVTSGLRLGTPAVTTRGLKEKDLETVADFIDRALVHKDDSAALAKIRGEVAEFCKKFPDAALIRLTATLRPRHWRRASPAATRQAQEKSANVFFLAR